MLATVADFTLAVRERLGDRAPLNSQVLIVPRRFEAVTMLYTNPASPDGEFIVVGYHMFGEQPDRGWFLSNADFMCFNDLRAAD